MNALNWHTCFFLLFSLLACGSAVAMVVTGDIVRMACWLVAALGAVAGLFFLAGADFLGAVQLMVYVGGTVVLLVFGVMLTARGPSVSLRIGAGQWLAAIVVGIALLAVLLQAAVSVPKWTLPPPQTASSEPTTVPLGMALIGIRPDRADQPDPVLRSGMSGYLLAFEIISIHLVVVLVGAAYLARAKRRVHFPASSPQSPTPNP